MLPKTTLRLQSLLPACMIFLGVQITSLSESVDARRITPRIGCRAARIGETPRGKCIARLAVLQPLTATIRCSASSYETVSFLAVTVIGVGIYGGLKSLPR